MAPVSPIRLKTLVEHSEVIQLAGPQAGIHTVLPVKLRLFDATAMVAPADTGELITLTAALPDGPGHAELVRQGPGLRSRLAQLREQKLGIDALDDAFLIACDDDGFSALGRCRRELETLLPCPPEGRIHVGAQLIITWDPERLDAMAHLWERVFALRIGA